MIRLLYSEKIASSLQMPIINISLSSVHEFRGKIFPVIKPSLSNLTVRLKVIVQANTDKYHCKVFLRSLGRAITGDLGVILIQTARSPLTNGGDHRLDSLSSSHKPQPHWSKIRVRRCMRCQIVRLLTLLLHVYIDILNF